MCNGGNVPSDEALLGPTKPFATLDLSTGFTKDTWSLEVFVKNATDSRGVLSINTDCATSICGPFALDYTTKPRLVGVKVGKSF